MEEFLDKYLAQIIILSIWELIWKGFALWRAAQNNQRNWFIALLFINSGGVLPILYLYLFSRPDKKAL